jgi:hypothetical protein
MATPSIDHAAVVGAIASRPRPAELGDALPEADGTPVDRGHLIPHLSGGESHVERFDHRPGVRR